MAGILEVCADSMESALAAERGGADRIELCGNLVIGGTTPSQALFEKIRKETSLKIRVLLRPRFGDFCYSQNEYEILKEEVKLFRRLGADGIVIGCLNPDGSLNMEQMQGLIAEAGDMDVALHRAFDVSRDALSAGAGNLIRMPDNSDKRTEKLCMGRKRISSKAATREQRKDRDFGRKRD